MRRGFARLEAGLLTGRYLLLLVVGGLATVVQRSHVSGINDWLVFEYGARVLVVGGPHYPGGLHLYAQNPYIQIGPPPLWAVGALQRLDPGVAEKAAVAIMLMLGLLVIALLERAAIRLGGAAAHVHRTTILAGSAVLIWWGSLAGSYHHLDDAMALAALAGAVLVCTREQPSPWTTALLIGFAAACKPWAIVALPLLLLTPRARRAPALLLVLVQVAAWWAPFALADRQTAASVSGFRLPMSPDAPLHVLGLVGGTSPSWERPAQLGLATLLGVIAVRRQQWPALLLIALMTRVVLDPQTMSYYAPGPLMGALLVDALGRRPRVPLTTLGVVLYYLAAHLPGVLGAAVQVALAVGTCACALTSLPRTARESSATGLPEGIAGAPSLGRTDQRRVPIGATS